MTQLDEATLKGLVGRIGRASNPGGSTNHQLVTAFIPLDLP
ncbi:hypothetical protein [Rhizobium laguerreae]|nr:hypothetical protein [Rhizobium laguerreae]